MVKIASEINHHNQEQKNHRMCQERSNKYIIIGIVISPRIFNEKKSYISDFRKYCEQGICNKTSAHKQVEFRMLLTQFM